MSWILGELSSGTLVPSILGPRRISVVVCLTLCPRERHVYLWLLAWVSTLVTAGMETVVGKVRGSSSFAETTDVKTFTGQPVAHGRVLGGMSLNQGRRHDPTSR